MGILDDAIREHLELKRSHGASDEEIRRKESEAFGPVRQEAAPAAEEAVHTPAEAPHAPEEPLHAEPSLHDELAPPPAPLDEHTQLIAPEDELQPAPEDPYAVRPGDALVPDPDVPAARAPEREEHPPPPAEAGAGLLEGHHVETGPPMAPIHDHHHDEQHPALVDHDAIEGEEQPPEPVFGHSAAAPAAPPEAPLEPSPVEDPPVGDPPVENPDIDEPPPRQSPEAAGGEDVLEETPEFLQDAPEHDRLWFEQKPPRDFDFGE